MNFLVIGLIASIRALNSVLLGRFLSKDSFGTYSLLFTSIVPLVSFIVILGQQSSILRYFSKQSFLEFRWKRYYRNTSIIFFVLISCIIFAIYLIYNLTLVDLTYLILSIFSFVSLIFIAGFIRSRGKFITSQLLMNISPIFFLFFIGFIFLFYTINLQNVIFLKTLSYIFPFILVFSIFITKNCEGSQNIPKRIYFDGLLLWGIALTQLAINNIDNLLIAKFLNLTAVAEYSIIFLFATLYDFASNAIWSVYSQRFSSNYKPRLKRFLARIFLIILLLSLFYAIAGRLFLHFLFNGKYDSAFHLLLPFCIMGSLKLLHVFPACYFVGKSSSSTLKLVLRFNTFGVMLKIILLIIGIIYLGLLGAVLSGVFVWCYRNIVGYWLVMKDAKAVAA